MDRVLSVIGYAEGSLKPELLVVYAAFAVLISLIVHWALATILAMLKPFTCAAILMAFIRPDLAKNFLREDCWREVAEKSKTIIMAVIDVLVRLGEQFRLKFQ